jgi:hypothetical protein
MKNIAFILTGLLVCSSPFKSIAEPLKNDQKLKPFSASDAPTPILRPRIGFFKVEPAMSQIRVIAALRPPVPDAVA